MTRLYLAGPMRGIEHLNFPAFDDAAHRLREAGYEVFNPADQDRTYEVNWGRPPTTREALTMDVSWISHYADGVAVLTGWSESLGAKAEVALASAIGIPTLWVSEWVARATTSEAAA